MYLDAVKQADTRAHMHAHTHTLEQTHTCLNAQKTPDNVEVLVLMKCCLHKWFCIVKMSFVMTCRFCHFFYLFSFGCPYKISQANMK